MTYPPPPNQPDPTGHSGAFGPPHRGFGPPAQPGGFGAYDLGQSFGPPPVPPPPPGQQRQKTALIVISALAVAGLGVGGVVLAQGGGTKDSASPTASASGSSTADTGTTAPSADTDGPGQGAPLGPDSSGSAEPTSAESSAPSTPSDLVPFVVLTPGQCFDHPGLDSSVTEVEKRSCSSPHDGEVIANETLTGTFSTEQAISNKALELCEVDATERLKAMPNPNGRTYYYYALYPAVDTYTLRGEDQVSCAITLSGTVDGPKLSTPLPN